MALCAALLTSASLAAAPRGVTAEDYFAFKNVTDAQLSPDGKLVAYVVTAVDEKANRRESQIWLAPTGGSAPGRPFTTGASSRLPRWRPRGHALAFVSARGGRPQVYELSLSGGEARQLTRLENGVDAFQWSPDGARLVCVSKVGPAAGLSDVRHYTSITYKYNDTGWYGRQRSHLFLVDAKTGDASQLTSGDMRNDGDPRWSPDGTRIAFVSEDLEQPLSRNNDIWAMAASRGPMARINATQGAMHLPRWSPDGGRIAYVGAVAEADAPQLWIAPAAGGGKSAPASKELDLVPAAMDWEAERELYFEAAWHGEAHAYRLDPRTGKTAALTSGPRGVHHLSVNQEAGLLAYTADDFTHLDDLYIADTAGGHERRLTDVNRELLGQLELQPVERISYRAADGTPLDGFFVKPLGWQEGKKYPMVLSVHGGPAGMYGVDWFHEFQVYAARGWAVFFCNPRGSSGYGAKFQRGIEKEWGGKDYTDIMSGVDAILAKYGWIDTARLGVTGGSYGGFMTNWIVGHTNRFKAAVTLRSISNFISDEGTRDGAYGHAHDFGGNLFGNFEAYWNASPLKYAGAVKTPTLILHSDNDLRVPLEQGEQWFRALKHFGVTTELVIFPRENHNLTRTGEPKHLVESLNWQVYWFDRFLNGNAAAVRPSERK